MSRPVQLAALAVLLSAIIAAIAVVAALSDDDDTPLTAESPSEQPATSGGPTPSAATPEGEDTDDAPVGPPREEESADSGPPTGEKSDESAQDDDTPPIPTSDLIVYNTLDGQIAITEPDGSMSWTITPDEGFFAWPLWSPDMGRIAFSGRTLRLDGTEALSLFVYSLEDNRTRVVYTNERGMGPILPTMPHYLYWSPDGTRLAFIASVSVGLTLFVADRDADGNATVVLRTEPLYESWSPDSSRLLVHGGADHYLIDLRNGPMSITNLDAKAINYRVPAWSPSDSQILLVSQDADGSGGLYASDAITLDLRLVEETPGEAAFLWSPDGELLAVAHSEVPGSLVYQGIRFFSRGGEPQAMRVDEPVLAFFWSPDGSRLAYVTEGEGEGFNRWMVLDVRDGERWAIADFIPSGAQATVFRLFDQFAYSHLPWSPDSASLVFSGTLQTEGVPAPVARQQPPQIVVADAGPVPAADVIADGFLAFWSPR
ncbi:MAG: PD40 domain-containing protein [Chloroflexi bacterium]|nr:PD40 domain-containing protein [Chloroflexota bacterium]